MSNFQSTAVGGIWFRRNKTVFPLTTEAVLILSEVNLKSVQIVINLYLPSTQKNWSATLACAKKNNIWRLVVSNIIGDKILKKIDIAASNGDWTLNIENLENIDIQVSLAYLTIQ